jgi:hypothetical protein
MAALMQTQSGQLTVALCHCSDMHAISGGDLPVLSAKRLLDRNTYAIQLKDANCDICNPILIFSTNQFH